MYKSVRYTPTRLSVLYNIIYIEYVYIAITLYIQYTYYTRKVCRVAIWYSGFSEQDECTEIFLSQKLGNKNILGSTDAIQKRSFRPFYIERQSLYYYIMLNVLFGCVSRRRLYSIRNNNNNNNIMTDP